MRLDTAHHLELARSRHWRVATLAADFELLDVWRFPVRAGDDVPLHDFITCMAGVQRELVAGRGAAGALFRLRQRLGRAFGWDDDAPRTAAAPRPIPGCAESSIGARLSAQDRAVHDAASAAAAHGADLPGFEPIYRSEEECLLELSNATVHALLHFGREPIGASEWAPLLGVYVKPRGAWGRAYMALIGPFRHAIVYPAMLRAAARHWPRYLASRSQPPAPADLQ